MSPNGKTRPNVSEFPLTEKRDRMWANVPERKNATECERTSPNEKRDWMWANVPERKNATECERIYPIGKVRPIVSEFTLTEKRYRMWANFPEWKSANTDGMLKISNMVLMAKSKHWFTTSFYSDVRSVFLPFYYVTAFFCVWLDFVPVSPAPEDIKPRFTIFNYCCNCCTVSLYLIRFMIMETYI